MGERPERVPSSYPMCDSEDIHIPRLQCRPIGALKGEEGWQGGAYCAQEKLTPEMELPFEPV